MMMRALSLALIAGCLANPAFSQTAYYVAPTGSDSNPGTSAAPFATLAKAQAAMQKSATKITYVRAGTYYPHALDTGGGDTVALHLTSADSGETWAYDPSDGIGTAVIDGGSSSATTGIKTGFAVDGANGVTVNGLQFQNFARSFLTAENGSPNTSFINNITHDNYDPSNSGGISLWESAQNSVIANNVIYNTVDHGILASTCSGGCAGGMNGIAIKNNFIFNTCIQETDCGAIYSQDYATPRSTNITIQNNFIRDVNPTGDGGGRGIYLDDGTSNVVVSGNIVSGHKDTCFNIHGGNNDIYDGNLCDQQSSGTQRITRYETSDISSLSMTGNAFTNNIIVAGSVGSGEGYAGDGAPNPATIKNNAYFNYVGSTINSNGSGGAGSDANPSYVNPQVTTWCYAIAPASAVFSSPVSFAKIAGGWGYTGFVLPSEGTPPSSPDRTACGGSATQQLTASISATPNAITTGQAAMLAWNSTDATSCVGADFSTGNAVSGSMAVAPAITTTYPITCYAGNGGSTKASATVTVTAQQTFGVGVRVGTVSKTPVKNKPNTKSQTLCRQPANALGTIAAGPINWQGYIWWSVNFDTGCDGWVTQSFLTLN